MNIQDSGKLDISMAKVRIKSRTEINIMVFGKWANLFNKLTSDKKYSNSNLTKSTIKILLFLYL